MAAKKYGARGVGVELDPNLVKISRQAAVKNGVADKVTFIEGDLFVQDISPATVVTMYLVAEREQAARDEAQARTAAGCEDRVQRVWDRELEAGRDESCSPDGSTVLLWTVPRPPARPPDVDFVPTPEAVAYEMLRTRGDECSRRGVRPRVRRWPDSDSGRAEVRGALGVGVELDPRLVEMSRQVARDVELADRVVFLEADLFDADISSATVVALYLSASVNAKLESKLRRDLRLGRESCPISSRSGRGHQRRSFARATEPTCFSGRFHSDKARGLAPPPFGTRRSYHRPRRRCRLPGNSVGDFLDGPLELRRMICADSGKKCARSCQSTALAEIRLVDEGRALQRDRGALVAHAEPCLGTQVLVDERYERLLCVLVSSTECLEQARDVGRILRRHPGIVFLPPILRLPLQSLNSLDPPRSAGYAPCAVNVPVDRKW